MSIAAYATAVRNYLRQNLTDFYADNADAIAANCKVMVDEHPTPNCGQEFISIYGSYHQPKERNPMQAIEEEFGLTIAVSRKIAVVPPDYRGELGYISDKVNSIIPSDDLDAFLTAYKSVEGRCREIVKFLHGGDRYSIMNDANGILVNECPITEPLVWLGTDPAPTQVGPDFFWGTYQREPNWTDDVFGLVMKVYFGEAIRFQIISDLMVQPD